MAGPTSGTTRLVPAAEFERIRDGHESALRARMARTVLGASVIRVFKIGTKEKLFKALLAVPLDELRTMDEASFPSWYERQLRRISNRIRPLNQSNAKVQPGLMWGHAAKVLSLFLRDMVLHTRYFTETDVERISSWLYVPIDGIVIRRLGDLDIDIPFAKIREIDTREKFQMLQNLFAESQKVGVPRVWFDDNWAQRM